VSYLAVASAANWPDGKPVGVVATSPGTGHRLMEIVSPDRDRLQPVGGRRSMPADRASGKHHQARITGQRDQAGTAGKRQN
jgi:hypothetical protein